MLACPKCGLPLETQKGQDIHDWIDHMTPAERKAWVLNEKPDRVAAAATEDPFRGFYGKD